MIGVARAVGRAMAAGIGRNTIVLVALAVLPLRGVLSSFTANPVGVVLTQLLDGIVAGIFGVVAVVIAADVMRGTGRFNLAQGQVALAVGIGAGLSDLVAGYVVQGFGYATGFRFLAAAALAALFFFPAFMPETRPVEETETEPIAYPLICALIANAASFVLPISDPANLVVLAAHMLPLLQWLGRFALPSAAAVAVTYGVLRLTQRGRLCRRPARSPGSASCSPARR